MQKKARLITDISMTLLMPLLMAYSLIGEKFHEIAGTAMLLLFIVHHVMNRKWFGSLFRGRYNASRVFRTAIDILLLIYMILQPMSGMLMSRYLYTFLPALPLSVLARTVHILLAYWGYMLISVHAGTHIAFQSSKLKKDIRIALLAACLTVSAYGCFAFVKRGFWGYMSGRTLFAFFDYDEPLIFFILDHIAVMVLFMTAGAAIVRFLSNSTSPDKKDCRKV